jgi:signal transduction histidine kinase
LQEQLQQSQKIEAIGQLTGGIAHDFNNLLAIVLGNLELLQEEMRGDAGPAQRVATAVRATLRGADLTKRLLVFARRQTLAPQLTQVNDLIRNMKELLRRPLGPTIDMELLLADDLKPAEIDPAQLETSLLNLIVNARDAMPEGGRLTIRTANAELPRRPDGAGKGAKPVDCIHISVTDTGNGMSPEVMARAFDPFFTTKGVGQGTGLGLSMVYGFVKQSGGHVQLDSEPGRGTTVSLYLPCSERSIAAPPPGDDAGLSGVRRLMA